MGINLNPFTWWNGASWGTMVGLIGKERVGEDDLGNVYYTGGKDTAGNPRRWVIYAGANDASRVPAEWHGWLHGSFDGVPESNLPPPRIWETEYSPNATGTTKAHRPHRDLQDTAYEAWSPDA